MSKPPLHETVAKKLIDALKTGTAPWQRPWDERLLFPYNPTTEKRYKGGNALHLMLTPYKDPRWMTYNQANTMEAQVKKGEKGHQIQYWQFTEERKIVNEKGETISMEIKLERPRVFSATVFNAQQIEGLPDLIQKSYSWNTIEEAENILKLSGATIHHGEARAFYRPRTDSIHLPDKTVFFNEKNYYATALHELSHWTGHSSRLNRDLNHPFGSEGYAREELRAEIASMILGDTLGIGNNDTQHASYVASWITILENDPLENISCSF